MAKVRVRKDNNFIIYCPACKKEHAFNKSWGFNNDFDKPTVDSSLLVNGYDEELCVDFRCHSFIKEGTIIYLGDCTHDMKGERIPLPECEEPK